MSAVDELLADLAAHPPSDPPPVGEIRGRARRRARRRRALVTAAAAVVLVAAGVGVGAAVTASVDDPTDEVRADGGGTSSTDDPATTASTSVPATPTASIPVATVEPAMTLSPASGFEDGTVVRMALDEPASGPATVVQCAAEVDALHGGTDDDLGPYCTGRVAARAEALQPFTLSRTILTPSGTIDCAEAVGRCTLGVRVGGPASGDDRFAPLAFRTDLAPVGEVEPAVLVDGDEGTVGDGDTLLVTVTGVATGEVITVQQCRPGVAADAACDWVRRRWVTVEEGPETQFTFTAFHDLYGDTNPSEDSFVPGWSRCEPCEVVVWVGDTFETSTRLPLAMEPTDSPIRPQITVDPAGPHRPGQSVTVRATGLQPSSMVDLGWCLAEPPWGGGSSACSGPQGEARPGTYTVRGDGTLELVGFDLPGPDDEVGDDCFAEPGVCGVGIDGVDGGSVAAFTPLDLSG